MDPESPEYKEWKKKHKGNCQINHEGSSGEMEAVSAVEMFEPQEVDVCDIRWVWGQQ